MFNSESPMAGRSEYPSGLNIYLNPETVKKLGITEAPKVGEEKMILAKVLCQSVSIDPNDDDTSELSISLQITEMEIKGLDKEPEKKDAAASLYGSES